MLGHTSATFSRALSSTKGEGGRFSVAMTTAFDALIPRLVVPCPTAARACSICTSLPLGEKVVSEKLYAPSPAPALILWSNRKRGTRGRRLSPLMCHVEMIMWRCYTHLCTAGDELLTRQVTVEPLLDHVLRHGPVLKQMVPNVVLVAVCSQIVVFLILHE